MDRGQEGFAEGAYTFFYPSLVDPGEQVFQSAMMQMMARKIPIKFMNI